MEYKPVNVPYCNVTKYVEVGESMDKTTAYKVVNGTKVKIVTSTCEDFSADDDPGLQKYMNLEDRMIESILDFKSYLISVSFRPYINLVHRQELVEIINELSRLYISGDYLWLRRSQILKVCVPLFEKYKNFESFFYSLCRSDNGLNLMFKKFQKDYENFKSDSKLLLNRLTTPNNKRPGGGVAYYHRVVTTDIS